MASGATQNDKPRSSDSVNLAFLVDRVEILEREIRRIHRNRHGTVFLLSGLALFALCANFASLLRTDSSDSSSSPKDQGRLCIRLNESGDPNITLTERDLNETERLKTTVVCA